MPVTHCKLLSISFLSAKTRLPLSNGLPLMPTNYDITVPPAPEHKHTLNTAFLWLLRLRWGAVICQTLLLIAVSLFLKISLPILIIFIIIVFEAVSNLLLAHYKEAGPHRINQAVVVIMFLDVSLLALLIHYTGGPMNPFTFLFLVHIVIGSLIMPPRWSWTLAVFTMSCYAVLFLLPPHSGAAMSSSQLLCHHQSTAMPISAAMRLHLKGMWLAFAITSIFIVFFVSKIQESLEEYQQTINHLQRARENSERLAALATLAAGAAHELSTPLAAIAVAAGEMQHTLNQDNQQDETRQELLDDTIFIKDRIKACKDILGQMSSDAGHPMGEQTISFNLAACLREIVKSYKHDSLSLKVEDESLTANLPPQTFRRVIRSLINNSIDACKDGETITISCLSEKGHREMIYIKVNDEGCGMDEETLARASDPFFTTKEPGKGMGLGLFLAKTVARRYGGDLQIQKINRGTRVIWSLARDHRL